MYAYRLHQRFWQQAKREFFGFLILVEVPRWSQRKNSLEEGPLSCPT
jgi:hypothetical protein